VVCKTEVPKPDMPGPDPRVFGEIVFRFHVIEVPDKKDALYRLEVLPENGPTGYVLSYRDNPFSLAGFERIRGGKREEGEKNGPQPFVATSMDRLVLDFPMTPPPERLFRPLTKDLHGDPFTQTFDPINDGARATLESPGYRVEFVWKKGLPWWSSVDRTYTPRSNEGRDRTFAGSGRLLQEQDP
jgi:hypothetical protein